MQECKHLPIFHFFLVLTCAGIQLVLLKGYLGQLNFFLESVYNLRVIVMGELFGFNYTLCVIIFIQINTLISVIGLTSIIIWRLRIIHMESIIGFKSRNSRKFYIFYNVYIRYLSHSLKGNRMHSKAFLVFLMVNYPTNCLVIFHLIEIEDLIARSILTIIFVGQVLGIFLAHLKVAESNKRLSLLSKNMMTQFVPINRRFPLRSNIRLNLFIQAFHTKHMYGAQYGNMGRISMMTFTKVSFICLICLTTIFSVCPSVLGISHVHFQTTVEVFFEEHTY